MNLEKRHSFTGRMVRRASLRASSGKRNLFKTFENQDITNNNEDESNESVITSISNAIDDLDRQIEALGIPPVKPEHPTNEINKMCKQKLYRTSTKIEHDYHIDETRISESNQIVLTPIINRKIQPSNKKSTRESITLMTQNAISRTNSLQLKSTDTTIAQNLDSIENKENVDGSRISEVVDAAFGDALKGHLNESSVTYGLSDIQNNTDSHYTVSELVSQERTPFYRKITDKFSYKRRQAETLTPKDDSFTLSENNSGMNRTTRLYRSLSQRLKKGIKGAIKRQGTVDNRNSPEVIEQTVFSKSKTEQMEKLLFKIKVEQTKIDQSRKALSFCRSSEEFSGSSEEIESERILLLAAIRKRLLAEELKKMSTNNEESPRNSLDGNLNNERAEVSIDKIRLTLRDALRKDPSPGDVTEWFIVVIIQGTNLWATRPSSCQVNNPFIEFPGFLCIITNLRPDLKITLEVYNLKLKAAVVYNHDDKYHINHSKLNKAATCPSPTTFLRKSERPLSPKVPKTTRILSTSFALSGYVHLGIYDLTLSSPWPLTAVPNDSILFGSINLNLSCKLHLSVSHQGFLTQCGEAGGIPTRNVRWCVLKGHALMLWKYRDDQEDKPALMTIDLINCTSNQIGVAPGSFCAKPRTILIETMRTKEVMDEDTMLVECRQSCTIVRHLLSCDTKKELDEWIYKLNHVISALREWNVSMAEPPPKQTPMVSDL